MVGSVLWRKNRGLAVTDPLGNVTQFTYNDLDWLVTEGKVYSGGTADRSFSYDGVGNRRSLTDRNGRLTEWDYDNRYHVTTETWKQGGSTVRTLDFTYDTVDRLTALDDSGSLATDFEFAYDQRGQLVAERQLSGLIGTSVVLTRQFDDRGNRSELAANFGGTLSGGSVSGGIGDFVNEYVYDERDRLGSVTQTEQSGGHAVAPKHATLIYNRASQLTDLRRYSADWASWSNLEVHSRREYDGAGRLVSITHGNQEISGSQTWDGTSTPPSSLGASGMLAAYRMDYDENHRLTSLGSYADGFETSFGYDDRDQLTSATSAAISGLSQAYGIPSSESYDLDENGNRKSSGGQSQSDPTRTTSYKATGRLTTPMTTKGTR